VKKKLKVNRKTLKTLKLKLKQLSDKKVAPLYISPIMAPTNGESC
jgi:hypothetical protein